MVDAAADLPAADSRPVAFARFDGLIDFYFEPDLADDIATFPLLSYPLVELAPGAHRAAVAERFAAANRTKARARKRRAPPERRGLSPRFVAQGRSRD